MVISTTIHPYHVLRKKDIARIMGVCLKTASKYYNDIKQDTKSDTLLQIHLLNYFKIELNTIPPPNKNRINA